MRIRDSRSCALEPEVRLTGLEREVYLACEDAPLEEKLGARLSERSGMEASPDDVAAAVRNLRRRLLVVAVDRRLVALGLRSALPPLPDLREFPGGLVEEGPWQWA